MPLPTDNTVNNLNPALVLPGWYPTGFIDQFIRKIPFQRIERTTTTVTWNRWLVPTMPPPPPPPEYPMPSTYAPNAALSNVAVDTVQKTVTLRRIGDTALVDQFSQMVSGAANDLLQMQIEAKKIGVIRRLGSEIIQGSGAGTSLSGLGNEQTTDAPNQTIVVTAGGANLYASLEDLHRLVNLVRASDGYVGAGADCIVTHERVVRLLFHLSEISAGGTALTWERDPELGVPIPHFQGIPIYIGQVANFDIWALKLTGPTGIRVLHGGGDAECFGIQVEPVPMQASQSNRGAFVGGYYALMVPEAQSLARLTGTTDGGLTSQVPSVLALPNLFPP